MYRSTPIACIAAAFATILGGGVGESWAQPSKGEGAYSGGTQGLQEKLYEERVRELQQNQSKPSEPLQSREGTGSSVDQSSRRDASSGRGQGNPEGRPGDSGSSSGRQTDQQGNR